MSTYLVCPEKATLREGHISHWKYCSFSGSSAWQQKTEQQLVTELGSNPTKMFNLLNSMNEIDTSLIALYMGSFIVMFIIGYSGGRVVKALRIK